MMVLCVLTMLEPQRIYPQSLVEHVEPLSFLPQDSSEVCLGYLELKNQKHFHTPFFQVGDESEVEFPGAG